MNTMVDEQEQMKVKKKRMKKKSRGSLCVQFVLVLRENVFVSSFLVRLVLRLFSCVCLLFNLVGVCVCVYCVRVSASAGKKGKGFLFSCLFLFPCFSYTFSFLGWYEQRERERNIYLLKTL